MGLVSYIIGLVLWIFMLVLFARMILSWVPVLVREWQPRGPMLVLAEVVYSITDPPLRALRKVIPPLRLGGIAIDLGFVLFFFAISLLITVLTRMIYTLPVA